MVESKVECDNVQSHHTKWCDLDVVLLDSEGTVEEPMRTYKDSLDDLAPVCSHWVREEDGKTAAVPSIEEIISWDFDVLIYEEDTLIRVAEALLDYYDIYSKFHVDRDVMHSFIRDISNRHEPVPYHNFYHAISTMHTVFIFLVLADAQQYLRDIEIFAALIAGLAHDVEHTGQNNDYHVKTKSHIAKRFNNVSVLENHSIAVTMDLWENDSDSHSGRKNILSGLNNHDKTYFREYFRNVVLFTDPSNHGHLSDTLIQIVNERINRGIDAFDKNNQDDRVILGKAILQASDISNPAHSNFHVAKDWCQRITTEFRNQAHLEKNAGLPVAQFMTGLDTEEEVAKMQMCFYKFMALPLFQLLGKTLPKTRHLAQNMIHNLTCYEKLAGGKTECSIVE